MTSPSEGILPQDDDAPYRGPAGDPPDDPDDDDGPVSSGTPDWLKKSDDPLFD